GRKGYRASAACPRHSVLLLADDRISPDSDQAGTRTLCKQSTTGCVTAHARSHVGGVIASPRLPARGSSAARKVRRRYHHGCDRSRTSVGRASPELLLSAARNGTSLFHWSRHCIVVASANYRGFRWRRIRPDESGHVQHGGAISSAQSDPH